MKSHFFTLASAVSGLLFAISTQAHDPKEHMEDAEAPNCRALQQIDNTDMDKSDPIMQAMLKKCDVQPHKNTRTGDDPGDSGHVGNAADEHADTDSEHK